MPSAREPAAARPEPPPQPGRYVHAGGWCEARGGLARVCGAEALGAALLVLLSAAPATPALPAALHAGLTVACLVQCLGGVSGAQLNPCVSLAALACGRMRARRAAAEVLAQLAGAALGAAALAALAAPGHEPLRAALTLPATHYSAFKAVCVEAVCGAGLALANCAHWDELRGGAGGRGGARGDSWALRIGATVAALAAFAGPLTGASMNPARSFGPALLLNRWQLHWVYWAGPLGGAAGATALYCGAWRAAPRPRPQRDAPPPAPPPCGVLLEGKPASSAAPSAE